MSFGLVSFQWLLVTVCACACGSDYVSLCLFPVFVPLYFSDERRLVLVLISFFRPR